MISGGQRFNTYFLLLLALMFACGCQSPETKRKKALSTLGVHLDASREAADKTEVISIPREHPVIITVQKAPFLTQNDVKEAKVVEVVGGFALRVQFDRRATLLLEQYSSDRVGKRFAIFSQFAAPPDQKLNKGRWLAAPRINHRIADGVLVFTPDATREETDQIALGLNNLAKELKKKSE